MKLTRGEKIWLIATVLLFVLYNLPFVPSYGDSIGTLIHGALTVVPLWIVSYAGLRHICRQYPLRTEKEEKQC
ncbi:MAG: hypothetical protein ACOX7F_04855 [Eubacteriales bacterium]|jgi:O-antigen/teichoic acid export membrane protein